MALPSCSCVLPNPPTDAWLCMVWAYLLWPKDGNSPLETYHSSKSFWWFFKATGCSLEEKNQIVTPSAYSQAKKNNIFLHRCCFKWQHLCKKSWNNGRIIHWSVINWCRQTLGIIFLYSGLPERDVTILLQQIVLAFSFAVEWYFSPLSIDLKVEDLSWL